MCFVLFCPPQGYKLIGSHSGVKLCRWTKVGFISLWCCFYFLISSVLNYQCLHQWVYEIFDCVILFSPCWEGEEDATNTHFTALNLTGVWRPLPVWPVPTSVFFAGGKPTFCSFMISGTKVLVDTCDVLLSFFSQILFFFVLFFVFVFLCITSTSRSSGG